jgi:hypothetical protein
MRYLVIGLESGEVFLVAQETLSQMCQDQRVHTNSASNTKRHQSRDSTKNNNPSDSPTLKTLKLDGSNDVIPVTVVDDDYDEASILSEKEKKTNGSPMRRDHLSKSFATGKLAVPSSVPYIKTHKKHSQITRMFTFRVINDDQVPFLDETDDHIDKYNSDKNSHLKWKVILFLADNSGGISLWQLNVINK